MWANLSWQPNTKYLVLSKRGLCEQQVQQPEIESLWGSGWCHGAGEVGRLELDQGQAQRKTVTEESEG